MRQALHGRVLPATSAVALGLLALIAVWAAAVGREPKQFDVKDPSFHFTFCVVTTGTTHTAISGNRLLGWINRQLVRYRIPRISRDQMYTLMTPRSETLLSIGYRHSNDVLKLNTNGHFYPGSFALLKVAVVQPGGRTIPVENRYYGSYAPTTKEYVNGWILPPGLTNWVDYGLVLSTEVDGKPVATCRLR